MTTTTPATTPTATPEQARARGPLPAVRAAAVRDDIAAGHEHLDYLTWSWSDLIEHRLHGTERHWTDTGGARSHAAAHRAAEAAERARLERLERVGLAPGQRPAPLRVDVLDVIHDVVTAVADVADALSDVLRFGPVGALPVAVDPRPVMQWARIHLSDAHALDERTAPWVANRLTDVVTPVAYALGDVADGQLLAGLCPWCGGRDEDGLEGTRTLRVRYPALGRAGDPVVVCTGTACDPPALSRALRTPDGLPQWTQHDWDHLAARLEPLT